MKNFSANGINTALWTPEWPSGAMSGECTSPSLASQPGNGYLSLELQAKESTCGGTKHPDTGSLIESNPADGKSGHSGFAYTYGYVEWRAYLVGVSPKGLGCPTGGCLPDWPALWSLSSTNANEIDTMEGLETLGQACYHIHPPPGKEGPGRCLSGSYNGWHTYASEWEPGVVKYFYDGVQVGELSSEQLNGTPQYLIADMVPPGCCGQPLVVPDELKLDYVKVWQKLPIVTTGAAMGKQPLQATLNGTVNSNGTPLSNCHFEYGTSTSYGFSAPCSGPESGESATVVSLAPGTTYHFRIVATNASGPAYGNDETFTTLGPVEAVTETATGIYQTEAVLNGTVNPRGYGAKYYFQYGETISYGASTPEAEAGAGSSPVPEAATIKNLEVGRVYHYRLVGTSGGVTSYGSDQTFTTETLTPSNSAVRDPRTGDEWSFYVTGSGGIGEWAWTAGEGWQPVALSGGAQAASGTNPIVVRNQQTGFMAVYYIANNGQMWNYNTNNAAGTSGWSSYQLTGGGALAAAGTSPSVVYNPSTGFTAVYYVGPSGQMWNYNWTSSTSWGAYQLTGGGATVAADTSPSVVYNPSTGFTAVYYVGPSGQMWNYNWTLETSWTAYQLAGGGAAAAADTSPSVVYNPSTGFNAVYYVGPSGQMWNYTWTENSWKASQLTGGGAAAAADTSPSAVYNPSTGFNAVYYVGPSGQMWNYNLTTKWGAYQLTGGGAAAAADTSPSAVYVPSTGSTGVFYHGPSEQMWNYQWTLSTSWFTDQLSVGGEGGEEASTTLTTPNSAVRDPRTGDEWSFYVTGSGGIGEWAWTAGEGWQPVALSGGAQAASGTNPIVVRNQQTGFMAVYYIANNGQMWNYNTNNAAGTSGWSSYQLTGGGALAAAGTSPSVVYNPSTGFTAVYYVGPSGQMWNYNWTLETSWTAYQLAGGGAAAAADTSPSVVYNPSTGFNAVYYVGPSGQMWNYTWTENSWKASQLTGGGAAAAADTSPSAVYNPSTGFNAVYYVGPSGQMWNYNLTTKWGAYQLTGGGAAAAADTSPSAVYNPSTGFNAVYYVGPSGQMWNYNWTLENSWKAYQLTGGGAAAAPGISPSTVYGPSTGFTGVFYYGPSQQMWNYNWTLSTSWSAYSL